LSHATQCIEAEKEIEDAPRSGEAIQVDRDGEAAAYALRQAAPAGNEGGKADAQTKEADEGERWGYGEDNADVAVRAVRARPASESRPYKGFKNF